MHYEDEKCVEELSDMKKKMMECFDSELCKGPMNVDTDEAGKVVDMIKDLAEAEKDILEACYYKAVISAMESGEEYPYGYTPNADRVYWDDGMMGYNNRRYKNGHYAPKGSGTVMGFDPTIRQMPYMDDYLNRSRDGYSDRHGRAYNEYNESKKHYTETKSEKDKSEMEMHANEHLSDVLVTLRDIWKGASPELRKRMKTEFSNFVGEMTT